MSNENLCNCGCGEPAGVYKTSPNKGRPKKFIAYHHLGHKSLEERFWEKVDKENKNSCWEWLASKYNNGYGSFYPGNSKNGLAHRISWEIHNNKNIPNGMNVLHSCDNRSCVNPDHLFLGTQQDNINDMHNKNRECKGEDHPHTNLTKYDVRWIRKAYAAGIMNQYELADKFGVQQQSISKIVNYKRWKHL